MSVNPEYPWLELYLQEPNAPEPFKCEWRRIREDLDALGSRVALLEDALRAALPVLFKTWNRAGEHYTQDQATEFDMAIVLLNVALRSKGGDHDG